MGVTMGQMQLVFLLTSNYVSAAAVTWHPSACTVLTQLELPTVKTKKPRLRCALQKIFAVICDTYRNDLITVAHISNCMACTSMPPAFL